MSLFTSKKRLKSPAEHALYLQELSDVQFAEYERTGDPLTEECARSNAIAAAMMRRGLRCGEDEVPADLARKYDWQGIRDAVRARDERGAK